MQTERLGLRNRIEKKAAYLQELEEQVWLSICYLYDYFGLNLFFAMLRLRILFSMIYLKIRRIIKKLRT